MEWSAPFFVWQIVELKIIIMLSILLNVNDEGVTVVHSSTTMVVVAFLSSAILFGILVYVVNRFFNIKEAQKIGGIRGYCPSLIAYNEKLSPCKGGL